MHDRKRRSVDSMHIRRAENGGYIVSHSYNNQGSGESYMPSTDHVVKNRRALRQHVDQHMGGPREEFSGGFMGGQKAAPTPAAGRQAARKRGGGVD